MIQFLYLRVDLLAFIIIKLFSLASNEGVDYEAVVFSIGKAFENDTKSVRVHAEIIAKKHMILKCNFSLQKTNPF